MALEGELCRWLISPDGNRRTEGRRQGKEGQRDGGREGGKVNDAAHWLFKSAKVRNIRSWGDWKTLYFQDMFLLPCHCQIWRKLPSDSPAGSQQGQGVLPNSKQMVSGMVWNIYMWTCLIPAKSTSDACNQGVGLYWNLHSETAVLRHEASKFGDTPNQSINKAPTPSLTYPSFKPCAPQSSQMWSWLTRWREEIVASSLGTLTELPPDPESLRVSRYLSWKRWDF